jgi:hypothetical protein
MAKLFLKRHERFRTVLAHVNEENFPHICISIIFHIYICAKRFSVYYVKERNLTHERQFFYRSYDGQLPLTNLLHNVIRFVSTSAKFGI